VVPVSRSLRAARHTTQHRGITPPRNWPDPPRRSRPGHSLSRARTSSACWTNRRPSSIVDSQSGVYARCHVPVQGVAACLNGDGV